MFKNINALIWREMLTKEKSKGRKEELHRIITIDDILRQSMDAFRKGTIAKDEIKRSIMTKLYKRSSSKKATPIDYEQFYQTQIHSYLDKAINLRLAYTKEYFRDIFYDDIAKLPWSFTGSAYAAVHFALRYEGIIDLIYMGHMQGKYESKFIQLIQQYATIDSPLMIVGQTGTGKELIARAIHTISNRRSKPFKEINCAAIPENMLESELFGYEIGAFTDAKKQKKGQFELAAGGIIFLDEIGKMSTRLQAKILRAIQEHKFNRLGSEDKEPIIINVRFVAAVQPNDLKQMLPDLVYRFGYPNVLEIPTLEERLNILGNVIIVIALNQGRDSVDIGSSEVSISREAETYLLGRHYTGNYRELENILKSAIIRSKIRIMNRHFHELRMSGEDIGNLSHSIDKCYSIDEWFQNSRMKIEIQKEDIVPTEEGNKDDDVKQTRTSVPGKLDTVPLKDIIEYAKMQTSLVIENKLIEVIKSGRDVKQTLIAEGMADKQYQNFLKTVRSYTGKKIGDLKRQAASSIEVFR